MAKIYSVSQYVISDDQKDLFSWCDIMCRKAKLLSNAATFRLRQHYTSYGKEDADLQPQQLEVEEEIRRTIASTGMTAPGRQIGYAFLEKLMRVNRNPDFFGGLPMQAAQQVLKMRTGDFASWIAACRAYKKDPSLFTGKPKMPHYIKGDLATVCFTNQDCRLNYKDGTPYLKLPMTDAIVLLGRVPSQGRMKEVKVVPFYEKFRIFVTFEELANRALPQGTHAGAVDLGIDNIAAFVSNDGSPSILYKGGYLKSKNQWYNKQMGSCRSVLMEGHDPKTHRCPTTKMMQSLGRKRTLQVRDELHKISSDIIRQCRIRHIRYLVIGRNKLWKQKTDMSKQSNQNFVQIPLYSLIRMIRYKAERAGIVVIEQEESYTSKASFLDKDDIPVYGKNDANVSFSGERIKRGLYRSKNGTVINADLNGAANILRKAMPFAFAGITDFSFLQNIRVMNFKDFHDCMA